MAELNRLSRWLINRRTERRAPRVLTGLGSNLRIDPAASALELGAGGGGLVALLQERYHPSRLTGTDFDPAQSEAAARFLSARWGKLPPSIELRVADALALPFPKASFDWVFAMMMLHHVEHRFNEFDQRPKALAEVRRVLRPGGRFVYSEMFRREEIAKCLPQLGFTQEFLRSGWRSDLAIYRAPI